MEFYWELITKDGETLEIPPSAVDAVNKSIANGTAIFTRYSGTIPISDVRRFRPTDKRYVDAKLLEEASQAFKQAIETEDGVLSRWVKKSVTRQKWERYFAPQPAFRKLRDDVGMVVMAFKLPVHLIDKNQVQHCNETEVQQLEK